MYRRKFTIAFLLCVTGIACFLLALDRRAEWNLSCIVSRAKLEAAASHRTKGPENAKITNLSFDTSATTLQDRLMFLRRLTVSYRADGKQIDSHYQLSLYGVEAVYEYSR